MTEQTTNQEEVFDVFAHQDAPGVDDADQVTDQSDDAEDDAEGDDPDADDGEEGSQTEDELEDYEEGGKTYKVHKDLKGHLLRESDYTKKTQALAAERKALEAEVIKVKEDDAAVFETRIALKQIQDRMDDLSKLTAQDWNYIRQLDAQNGTSKYDELQREFLTLPRKADETKAQLDQKSSEAVQRQQAILAKRAEEGFAILERDIPGWGPELGNKLVSFVKSEYGVDESDPAMSQAFMNPALVKLAHDAFKAKQATRKAATTRKAEDATKNTPPRTASRAAPIAGLRDDLPTDEWARRRNAELAKKRA